MADFTRRKWHGKLTPSGTRSRQESGIERAGALVYTPHGVFKVALPREPGDRSTARFRKAIRVSKEAWMGFAGVTGLASIWQAGVAAHRALAPIDLAIIGVYFLVVFGIGFYFSRKERTSEEYFLAGRDIGWFFIGEIG